jgi:hypothetical protein
MHCFHQAHETAMWRRLFLLFLTLSMAQISASGQRQSTSKAETLIAQSKNETEADDDSILAGRAIAALRRLAEDVLVYRTAGDFEADGRLARVSLEVFTNHLQEVSAEVEPILSRLPQNRLKVEISNALCSYRDGGFWWEKIHEPRVLNVSAAAFAETSATPSEVVFKSTVPHTVAIHWKQAGRYLKRATELITPKRSVR